MDEKQLQELWELHAKNGGFASYGEFKSLMEDSNARQVYFNDANRELGFKDYADFEETLGIKKKGGSSDGGEVVETGGGAPAHTPSSGNGQELSAKPITTVNEPVVDDRFKQTHQLKNEFVGYINQNIAALKDGAKKNNVSENEIQNTITSAVDGDPAAIKKINNYVMAGGKNAPSLDGYIIAPIVGDVVNYSQQVKTAKTAEDYAKRKIVETVKAQNPKANPIAVGEIIEKNYEEYDDEKEEVALSKNPTQYSEQQSGFIDAPITGKIEQVQFNTPVDMAKKVGVNNFDADYRTVLQNRDYRLETKGLEALYNYESAELARLNKINTEKPSEFSKLEVEKQQSVIDDLADKWDGLYKKYPQVAQQSFERVIKDQIATDKTGLLPHFWTSDSDVDEAVEKQEQQFPGFKNKFKKQIDELKGNNIISMQIGTQGLPDAVWRGFVSMFKDTYNTMNVVQDVAKGKGVAASINERAAAEVASQFKASDLPTSFSASSNAPKITLNESGDTFIQAKNDLSSTFNNVVNKVGESLPSLLQFAALEGAFASTRLGTALTKMGKLSKGLTGEVVESMLPITEFGKYSTTTNEWMNLGTRGLSVAKEADRAVGLLGAQYMSTFSHNYDDFYYKFKPKTADDLNAVKTAANIYTMTEGLLFYGAGVSPNNMVRGTLRKEIGEDIYKFVTTQDLTKITSKDLADKMYSTWKDKIPAILESSAKEGGKLGSVGFVQEAFKDVIDAAFNPGEAEGVDVERYKESAKSMGTLGMVMGMIGNLHNYKDISPSQGDVLFHIGANSDKFNYFVDTQVRNGVISQERANEVKAVINTAKGSVAKAQNAVYSDGTPMVDADKIKKTKEHFKESFLNDIAKHEGADIERINAEKENVKTSLKVIEGDSPHLPVTVELDPQTLQVKSVRAQEVELSSEEKRSQALSAPKAAINRFGEQEAIDLISSHTPEEIDGSIKWFQKQIADDVMSIEDGEANISILEKALPAKAGEAAPADEVVVPEVKPVENVATEIKPETVQKVEAPVVAAVPKEGDIVELDPQVKGGNPRKMIFTEGEWKQQVGGETSRVGELVKKQANDKFIQQAKPEEVTVTTSPANTFKIGLTNALTGKQVEELKNKVSPEEYARLKSISDKIDQAQELQNKGDHEAANKLYNEVLDEAETKVRSLFSDIPEISIEINRTKGNYFLATEPTFEYTITDKANNIHEIVRRLGDIANTGFRQDAVHVSEILNIENPPDGQLFGVQQADLSVYEPNVELSFNRELTDKEVTDLENLIQEKGLAGSTRLSDKKGLVLYNISNFKDAREFIKQVGQVTEALHSAGVQFRFTQNVRKLWNIGKTEGAGFVSYRQAENLSGSISEAAIKGKEKIKEATPVTESGISVYNTEPVIKEEAKDLGVKAREEAAKFRSGEKNVLPEWMRSKLPPGTKTSGLSANEAYAKALETFADIHDATKDFVKAVEEGFKHIKAYFDDNKIPYNEEELKAGFSKDAQSNGGGEPPFTLVKAEIQSARNRIGMNDFVWEGTTHEIEATKAKETIDKWRTEGSYDKNINEIIDDAMSNKISNEGQHILAQHIADLQVTKDGIADKNTPEYDIVLKKLYTALEAADMIRSNAGQILGMQAAVLGKSVESLSDVEVNMMEDHGTDILTPEQKAEAQQRYDEIKKALDKERELNAQLEEEKQKLKEDIEFKRAKEEIRKQRASKKPTTREDYQKERQVIKKSIKDKWKGAGGQAYVTLPLVPQLVAIAPDVARLIKSYVHENANITIDAVRSFLKKDLEEDGIKITDEEVRGLIAGRFNEQKESKNELAQKLYELRQQENLMLKIEALERGEIPVSSKGRTQRNINLTGLRKQLDGLERVAKLGRYSDEARLQSSENAAERSIEALEKKINENDIEIKKAGAITSPKLEALREKQKQLREELEQKRKDGNVGQHSDEEKFVSNLKSRIEQNKRKQAEFEEKVNAGNFAPDPIKESILLNKELQQKHPKLYDDYLKSQQAKEEAIVNYERKRIADKQKNRGALQMLGNVLDVALNTSKGVVAVFDQSMALNQLLLFTAGHPIETLKYATIALRDLVDASRFNRQMSILHKSALWPIIEKSGLAIYEPRSAKNELRTELHGGDKNILNKNFFIGGKKFSVGQAFERSASTFFDNARLFLFSKEIDRLMTSGKTTDNALPEYQSSARAINELTAHGKLHKALEGDAGKVVGGVIWSPKMFASTLNILGLGDLVRVFSKEKGFYGSLPVEQKKFMAKELGRALTTAGVLATIGAATGAYSTDLDPLSISFGEIKLKGSDKSIPLFGRFGGLVKTLVQSLSGRRKIDGKIDMLGDKFGDKTAGDIAYGGLVRGKMTPAAGMFVDVVLNNQKQYYTKENLTLGKIGKGLIMPIAIENAIESFKNDKPLVAAAESLWSIYGGNVKDQSQFRDQRLQNQIEEMELKYTADDFRTKEFQPFIKNGVQITIPNADNISIKDIKKATKKALSDYPKPIVDKFYELRMKNFKDEVNNLNKSGVYVDKFGDVSFSQDAGEKKTKMASLNADQLREVMKHINGKVREETLLQMTKKKLFKTK